MVSVETGKVVEPFVRREDAKARRSGSPMAGLPLGRLTDDSLEGLDPEIARAARLVHQQVPHLQPRVYQPREGAERPLLTVHQDVKGFHTHIDAATVPSLAGAFEA